MGRRSGKRLTRAPSGAPWLSSSSSSGPRSGASAVCAAAATMRKRPTRVQNPGSCIRSAAATNALLRGQGVQLWRESATDAAVAELTASLEDASGEAHWDAGEQRASWPTEVPISDETIYLLRLQDSLRSLPIRLHLLAPGLAGNGLAAAAWLAARGCTEQARLLLR